MTPADHFGTLPDGREIGCVTLRDGALSARVLTLGAIVQDLRLEGVEHPLVLGCPDPVQYLDKGRYFGAIVGRFANRIGGGRFVLDGQDYRTDRNFRGRHTLHGGAMGTDMHLWQIEARTDAGVILSLRLEDGDMGFPGAIDIMAVIALSENGLSISLSARSDRATPCSLTHHGYFDLDGRGDIRNHRLMINAEHYLPVDDDLIPEGYIEPVAGNDFDFRQPRAIGDAGYDHNFCLSQAPGALRTVARLTGASGLSMRVQTTACGLQLYDGAHLRDIPGLDGRVYGPHAGVALEAQHWPDAPNHPGFPDAILRPGQLYAARTCYHFG
ncbi:MAG: aldose epimerase family protein [Paracoccus sp. (in: a-proteobacteria)]|uniref:aldose epimerase family protein n=1 Tax=Paracoccus sp. TaxID=267 RepID=UPI00391C5E41